MKIVYCGSELYHHGTKGQKWGIRNYQNPDGSYTSKGQAENNGHGRYGQVNLEEYRKTQINKYKNKNKILYDFYRKASKEDLKYDYERKERIKNVLIGTAIIGGVVSGTYIAYRYGVFDKLNQLNVKDTVSKEKLEASKLVMQETLSEMQNDHTITLALQQEKDFALNEDVLSRLDDITISKGQEIHRIVGEEGIDFSNSKDFIYTSFDKNDVIAYRRLLADHFYTGKKVEVVFEATKDLAVPSKNTTMNIFNELFYDKDNSSYRDSLIDTAANFYKERRKLSDEDAANYAKQVIDSDPFGMGMYFLVRRGNDSKIFADKLKEKGYNAVIDYFDAGSLGDKPLIVLDPSNSLAKKGEQIVNSLNLEKDIDSLFSSKHISIKDYDISEKDDLVDYLKRSYKS